MSLEEFQESATFEPAALLGARPAKPSFKRLLKEVGLLEPAPAQGGEAAPTFCSTVLRTARGPVAKGDLAMIRDGRVGFAVFFAQVQQRGGPIQVALIKMLRNLAGGAKFSQAPGDTEVKPVLVEHVVRAVPYFLQDSAVHLIKSIDA